MTDRTMIDSAYPLHPEPVRDITLVYIGGDTPHSWTPAEVRALPSRWVLPTWVRSDPQDVYAAADAAACIARLAELGVPKGTTVCLDLETAVSAIYVTTFNRALHLAGYWTLKYGSRDFIWRNPQTSGGTFVADPTGVPHMDTTGDCVATQYAFDGRYDSSLVKNQATVPLWEINPTNPPPPVPWEETMIKSLPLLKSGDTGQPVRRVQGLLRAAGESLGQYGIDGNFGHDTLAAVESFQRNNNLADDGKVGRHTWAVLVTGADL